jgi:hypothetical protein
VTDQIRQRIEGERDIARLEAWHEAAVTARSLSDVFGLTARARPIGARAGRRQACGWPPCG